MINYFELFDCLPSIKIDTTTLQKKYYELCKKYHPDSSINHSSITIIDINRAYEILKNFEKRLSYFLQFYNQQLEEENTKLSNAFLMEMLDINEKIDEYKNKPDKNKKEVIMTEIDAFYQNEFQKISYLIDLKDLSKITSSEIDLLKNFYLKKKYLDRLKNNFN